MRYARAVVLNALPASRPSRRLAALLLAVLCAALLAGSVPRGASAQGLVPTSPVTKEEAKQQADAAAAAASKNTGGSVPLIAWFGIGGVLVIAGATFYMLRDAGSVVDPDRRRAPARQPVTASSTRGAPKGMFEGEGAPGGQTKRSKNRAKAKRQKQARRANRPK